MTHLNPAQDALKADRIYLNKRLSMMDIEYQSFQSHYKDLSEFIDPRRGRFFVEDRNRGSKSRFKNIINNRGTIALRTATAGMFAGAMSPSRPWFAWSLLDRVMLEDAEVKVWLELFQQVILAVLNQSNFYSMAPQMLRELLLFGTGCMTHDDDFEDIARFYTHTVGSYRIAQNSKLVVDTLVRLFQMTTLQIVEKFGLDNVSQAVKTQYDNSNYDNWHTVCHFIEPNPNFDPKKLTSEFAPFRSLYFEKGNNKGGLKGSEHKFLRRRGFQEFPAYVPRWELAGEDIYAVNCPGMTTLGDIKQLQTQEREKAKAIAKATTPPLQGPPSTRNQPINNLPGGYNINSSTNAKIESIYNVDPRIQEMMLDIQSTGRRIDEGFFVNLFLAITEMEGIQPKNELQLSQINEERLLQLGPVLEQIHGEWLDKMVQRVGRQILSAGIMPPAPEILQGKELELEFVSALAMAQRAVATSAMERTIGFANVLTQSGWDVRAKINGDFALGEYSTLVGSPARMIVPDDEAQEARDAQQAELQRQQQLEQAEQMSKTAKNAADSKLGDDNILSRTIES